MSQPINDGGPAFPHYEPMRQIVWHGMTVRDYFAGQALAGLLAGRYSDDMRWNLTEVPQEAYSVADAMLAARAEGAR